MAKLGSYYGLCPLIDHRSLLGVSAAAETGTVIVTLGKNIAVKYKLSDQKQINSWRTKEKFSSPIIYSGEQAKYVAVFNESFIRLWNGDDEVLDKLKKIKFNNQIHTIFQCGGKSFIVFKNGAVRLLQEAVENRKELHIEGHIDASAEYISEVLYSQFNGDVYVGLVVFAKDKNCLWWTKFGAAQRFYKIELDRPHASLQGYLFHGDKFLSLWNDGRIYAAELKDSDLDPANIGDLYTVVESLSCKEFVSMASLDQNYIALYGCNPNDEGALLVIYNVQFKVVQYRQPFKLFTNGAKLWRIEGSLVFPVGQNLAVIPFYLDAEQLAALVGSHKTIDNDPDADVAIVQRVQFASWGKQSRPVEDDVPDLIVKSKIVDFLAQGISESVVFETISANLMEGKDLAALSELLSYFGDIPENCLVGVLKFVLNVEEEVFQKHSPGNCPQDLQPAERAALVDLIFTKPFNESLILPSVRSLLDINEVLSLLRYVQHLLSEEGHDLPSLNALQSETRLIEWSCVLLDANYQRFLLTRDQKVNDVLLSLRDHFREESSSLQDLRQVLSLMNEIKRGKPTRKAVHTAGLDYCIEEFPLYN